VQGLDGQEGRFTEMKHRHMTLKVLAVAAGACGITLTGATLPAGAVIHEQVAAYCSGGGHGVITNTGELEPPGIADPTNPKTFGRPVIANGVVDPSTLTITDRPAAKFPAGTSVFDANVGTTSPDHPSANCAALQP
jgi:hypothetical protein